MPKIITAKDILKEKGVSVGKFNTNKFILEVGRWFSERDVSKTLIVESKRFVDKPDTITDFTEECFAYGLMNIHKRGMAIVMRCPIWLPLTDEERSDGFRGPGYRDRIDKTFNDASQIVLDYFDIRFFVDEPFFANARAALQVMCGYVVKKHRETKNRNAWAEVRLM